MLERKQAQQTCTKPLTAVAPVLCRCQVRWWMRPSARACSTSWRPASQVWGQCWNGGAVGMEACLTVAVTVWKVGGHRDKLWTKGSVSRRQGHNCSA